MALVFLNYVAILGIKLRY